MSDTKGPVLYRNMAPGEWQAGMMSRLARLGYAGFNCGPGVRWWPINTAGERVAGPFKSQEEFDAWLDKKEAGNAIRED